MLSSVRARWSPQDWPLGVKLGLIILLIAIPASVTSTYVSVQNSLDRVRQSELAKLNQIATTISGQIAQALSAHQAFSNYLSREPRLLQLLAKPKGKPEMAEVTGRLNAVVASNAEVELLMLMNPLGEVLSSSDPALLGRNFAFREYFKVAAQGRPFTTSIIVGAVAGNAGVFFSNPVFDTKGQVVGVFVVKMLSRSYSQLIEQAAKGSVLQPFLLDKDKVIIHHPDRSLMYKSLVPLPEASQKAILEDKRFRTETVEALNLAQLAEGLTTAASKGVVVYEDAQQIHTIAGFAPVATVDWTVVVAEPESVFSEPLEQLFSNFQVVMVAVGVIVLLITLLVSRLFVSPIRALAYAAAKVELGQYEKAQTRISSQDEVGQLSRAFNNMLVGIRDREKVKDVFGRMVSPEVREKLLEGSLSLGGESARVSILFSDIRGFSSLSEEMPPQEVVELLNEYLTEMSIAVRNWGGYINNFIGDAIVVVFGVPIKQENIETRAVFAALEMRERLNSLNKRRLSLGKVPLRNGIGISTGDVVAGQMGSLDRFLYTVIGDAVNVAARLEGLTKDFPDYPILINQATYEALKPNQGFVATDLGEHLVKGRQSHVRIWGIVNQDLNFATPNI